MIFILSVFISKVYQKKYEKKIFYGLVKKQEFKKLD
ncbi:hypothetical protein SPCG_0823 [Streptococcus pneumoniae CGSP14]|nr:hypothetical protein SPCG_0823 [Streptococcus pneumoniae CGSP14]EFL66574.1 hypothetical protein CGSSp14BS292_03653 [Streptococcus pneumoniae SP14-BS292]EFL68899.1 hypothetical protein CGSSpBS293_11592 [Streptococcus pneumoniae SP-BS293]EFL71472.1 hypothetical protein CGSSpBS458_04096 [Streptococcus pneumoniae BS458]EFL73612.1 hypothetical protein CGSSpBS457_04005 [Streptococcus pneumoniae BS457]EFL75637.1 hypothetical protein CGSSpBS397_04456 [Streptococcus pneumoniae BS397]